MSTGKPSQNQQTLTWRGVMANAVAAERKAASVASDMFKLAQKCQDVDEFLAKTKMEEDWVLSEEAGQSRMEEVPRCWTQAKSDIKGAFKAGLDLTKIPSYSKMKIKKAEANGRNQATAEATDAENTNTDGQADRNPRHATGQEREAKADNSLAEALANGTVVDAKSTELVPPELRELFHLLAKLNQKSELRRAKLVKQFIKAVNDELSIIGQERKMGGKHAASA